jgi:hypothetical protein
MPGIATPQDLHLSADIKERKCARILFLNRAGTVPRCASARREHARADIIFSLFQRVVAAARREQLSHGTRAN